MHASYLKLGNWNSSYKTDLNLIGFSLHIKHVVTYAEESWDRRHSIKFLFNTRKKMRQCKKLLKQYINGSSMSQTCVQFFVTTIHDSLVWSLAFNCAERGPRYASSVPCVIYRSSVYYCDYYMERKKLFTLSSCCFLQSWMKWIIYL